MIGGRERRKERQGGDGKRGPLPQERHGVLEAPERRLETRIDEDDPGHEGRLEAILIRRLFCRTGTYSGSPTPLPCFPPVCCFVAAMNGGGSSFINPRTDFVSSSCSRGSPRGSSPSPFRRASHRLAPGARCKSPTVRTAAGFFSTAAACSTLKAPILHCQRSPWSCRTVKSRHGLRTVILPGRLSFSR